MQRVFLKVEVHCLLEITAFNNGHDYMGKDFAYSTEAIYPFSVVNSYATNMGSIAKKIRKKVEAGTFAIMTQPVYDLDVAKELIAYCEEATKTRVKKCMKRKWYWGIYQSFVLEQRSF